jgi:hypothetical protein
LHWGLAAGCVDAAIDLRAADLIIETSAGAVVGSQLALGRAELERLRAAGSTVEVITPTTRS